MVLQAHFNYPVEAAPTDCGKSSREMLLDLTVAWDRLLAAGGGVTRDRMISTFPNRHTTIRL
jgi:hypothetical protein